MPVSGPSSLPEPFVRERRESDRARILGIRNEVVRSSLAILEYEPQSDAEWDGWWTRRDPKLPFLVLDSGDGSAAGYALLSFFGDRIGYRVTGEVSIHLAPEWRGRGLGRRLFERLIDAGRAYGFHSLLSRITSENTPSIKLHRSLGFVQAGELREVARKFDRFVDVGLFQLPL
jgi:phosphinothricin acetyltransferase